MKNKIWAICIKSYPDDEDMFEFVEGNKKLDEIRIYHKGKKYLVNKGFDKKYYQII